MQISKKILIYILISMVVLMSFLGCIKKDDEYKKYSYEFFGAFDTIIQVMGYTGSEREFNKYSKYVYERYIELNQLFDIYKDYDDINNIKTINDNAGIKSVVVSQEIIGLLKFCIDSNKNISSKVNIALGPVLNLWHIAREDGMSDPVNAKIPLRNRLDSASTLTDIDKIIIDKNTVFLKEEGMSLDVGAVAKGYATQLVSEELIKMGFKSFLLSSGGNVKAVGAPLIEDKEFWSIGLQNPYYFENTEKNKELIDIAYIENTSVVSSGDYQRFYYVDGKKYHHIIDPDTLMPSTYFNAVTVFAKDSGLADFLSTVVFLMPYDNGRALVDGLDDVEAYWVFTDGTAKATDNIISNLKNLGGATN